MNYFSKLKICISILIIFLNLSCNGQVELQFKSLCGLNNIYPIDIDSALYEIIVKDSTTILKLSSDALLKNDFLFIALKESKPSWAMSIWIDSFSIKKTITIDNCNRKYNVQPLSLIDSLNIVSLSFRDSIFKISNNYDEVKKQSFNRAKEYIGKHINDYYSLIQLNLNQSFFSKNELYQHLIKFDTTFQSHHLYREILNKINYSNVLKIGDSCPIFSVFDKNSNVVSFKNIKNENKIILFWGNFCVSCKPIIDTLSSWQNNNKYKKLRIIFISIDLKKTSWLESKKINKNSVENYWTDGGFNGKVPLMFYVNAVPYIVVVNKFNKVIFIDYGINSLKPIESILKSIY